MVSDDQENVPRGARNRLISIALWTGLVLAFGLPMLYGLAILTGLVGR